MVNKTSNKVLILRVISEVQDMRDLRVISGPVWDMVWEVDSGSILGSNEVNSRPYLGNLIKYTLKGLHLAVGRALTSEID